jgi:D-alanine--poly(phosphoribitol) ligase subunit 2
MNILETILYPCVDEAKESIETAVNLEKTPESVLFGADSLDSLGIVRFIILVEEKIEDETDLSITLANEKAMSRKNSPFKTLQALADYIQELMIEEGYNA